MADDSEEEEDRTIRSVEISIAGEGTASTAYLLKLSLLRDNESGSAKRVQADLVVPGIKGKPDDVIGRLKELYYDDPTHNSSERRMKFPENFSSLPSPFATPRGSRIGSNTIV
jgi:hypothetical protein